MAGTRIKIKGEIPAEALEDVKVSVNHTAAQANAWLEGFEQTMLAAGFTRTSDTGQLATLSTSVSSADLGYRMYALNDEHSTTSPLIVKVWFGGRVRGASNTNRYRIRCVKLEAAGQSDGAGLLIAPSVELINNVGSMSSASAIVWAGAQHTYAWRKDFTTVVAVGPNSGSLSGSDANGSYTCCSCEFFLAVSRLRDSEGNIDLAGFMLYGGNPTGPDATSNISKNLEPLTSVRLADDSAPSQGGGACAVLMSPSNDYAMAPGSKPIMQVALKARGRDGGEYPIPGILAWQNVSALTPHSSIQVSKPEGEAVTHFLLGYCFAFYDLTKLDPLVRVSTSSVSVSIGSQLLNTTCGIALDWSDV